MVVVRVAETPDVTSILSIYQAGLDEGHASFETVAPDTDAWERKFDPRCRLVAVDGQQVVGWAAVAPTSSRACYAGVAEVSVYVASSSAGRGVGSQLLAALIAASETAGIWTLTASIFPENEASLRLHERHGFKRLGVRERIAQHRGVWRDTIVLERRSARVGTNDERAPESRRPPAARATSKLRPDAPRGA